MRRSTPRASAAAAASSAHRSSSKRRVGSPRPWPRWSRLKTRKYRASGPNAGDQLSRAVAPSPCSSSTAGAPGGPAMSITVVRPWCPKSISYSVKDRPSRVKQHASPEMSRCTPRAEKAVSLDPERPPASSNGATRGGLLTQTQCGATPESLALPRLCRRGTVRLRAPKRGDRSCAKYLKFLIGEVAERFKAAVLKTADSARGPGVRIPPSPPRSARPRSRRARRRPLPARARASGADCGRGPRGARRAGGGERERRDRSSLPGSAIDGPPSRLAHRLSERSGGSALGVLRENLRDRAVRDVISAAGVSLSLEGSTTVTYP